MGLVMIVALILLSGDMIWLVWVVQEEEEE